MTWRSRMGKPKLTEAIVVGTSAAYMILWFLIWLEKGCP